MDCVLLEHSLVAGKAGSAHHDQNSEVIIRIGGRNRRVNRMYDGNSRGR